MSTATTSPQARAGVARTRKVKHTPPLTLTATHVRGRHLLTGTYASSRPGVAPHTTEGRDDGTVLGCSCPGYLGHGHCHHGDNLALDWFAATWAGRSLAALEARTADLLHYLRFALDPADEAAVRIELTAIGHRVEALTRQEVAA